MLGGGAQIITAIMTYYMIIVQIKNARKRFRTGVPNQNRMVKKEYLVPITLISSYLLLYIVPYLITNFSPRGGKTEFETRMVSVRHNTCLMLPQLGVIVDAFTYIFLGKQYRNVLLQATQRSRSTASSFALSVISTIRGEQS